MKFFSPINSDCSKNLILNKLIENVINVGTKENKMIKIKEGKRKRNKTFLLSNFIIR